MKKSIITLTICMALTTALYSCGGTKANAETSAATVEKPVTPEVPTVYFIKEITPENIMKIYNALGRKAQGKKVAVKLSTGEAGNPNHLAPSLIKELVQGANGTIIEGNTAYGGKRSNTASHLKVAEEHGFTAIAPVHILDTEGQVEIPVTNGKHLKHDIVGKEFLDYDFLMVLSHFKGHPMAGMGGALKNISIGIASPAGKGYIHSGGRTDKLPDAWSMIPADTIFQESMAEAAEAIINHIGEENMLYINVANNLSVDCHCLSNPAPVEMADIGIFASLDPVAVDRACLDAVRNSDDHGKVHLIERIESKHAPHILKYAEQIGLGSQKYNLVELK